MDLLSLPRVFVEMVLMNVSPLQPDLIKGQPLLNFHQVSHFTLVCMLAVPLLGTLQKVEGDRSYTCYGLLTRHEYRVAS